MPIPLLDDAVAVVYPLVATVVTMLNPVGGATSAIVLCTLTLRLALLPLTLVAVRGERARAALAPQAARLQRRYRKDPARLGRELSMLYREAGTSPTAGCLPTLLQAPFFMVWYGIFTQSHVAGEANVLLSQRLLGSSLSARMLAGGHLEAFLPLLAALLVLAGVAVWRARRVAAAVGSEPPRGLLAVLPFVGVSSVFVMPLAAVVYLVTTQTWTAVENLLLRRGLPAAARPAVP